jgi:hypothetical protein
MQGPLSAPLHRPTILCVQSHDARRQSLCVCVCATEREKERECVCERRREEEKEFDERVNLCVICE